MKKLYIVSTGAGGTNYLTREAIDAINDYLMYEIINKQATILVLNGYFGV